MDQYTDEELMAALLSRKLDSNDFIDRRDAVKETIKDFEIFCREYGYIIEKALYDRKLAKMERMVKK